MPKEYSRDDFFDFLIGLYLLVLILSRTRRGKGVRAHVGKAWVLLLGGPSPG